MTTHTPGPWDHVETLSRSTWIRTGKPTHEAIECQRALAERDRLKAINDKLLAALKAVVRIFEWNHDEAHDARLAYDTAAMQARAIIAKAQGKSHTEKSLEKRLHKYYDRVDAAKAQPK